METEFHWHCWAAHKEVIEGGGRERENGLQLITYPQVKEETEEDKKKKRKKKRVSQFRFAGPTK